MKILGTLTDSSFSLDRLIESTKILHFRSAGLFD